MKRYPLCYQKFSPVVSAPVLVSVSPSYLSTLLERRRLYYTGKPCFILAECAVEEVFHLVLKIHWTYGNQSYMVLANVSLQEVLVIFPGLDIVV